MHHKLEQAIAAQAHIHHAYLLGLQLMVSTNKSSAVVEDWMFKLFRRQHEQKFLSSFHKLGLAGLPDAVACAKYHVLSNGIGGVAVEYMAESNHKAWVRFRYPRWMYDGPTICGVPIGVSRGFLRGWYAQNGVSLNNPKLGFVCVSEDMTAEYGLCGYFREYDHELSADQRLQFRRDEQPPPYVAADQPTPPTASWDAERLLKANRNYAMDYVCNGLITLQSVIGKEDTLALGGKAARLIGLQYLQDCLRLLDATEGSLQDAAEFFSRMMQGLGDVCEIESESSDSIVLRQSGLKLLRAQQAEDHPLLLSCWQQLWQGAAMSFQQRKILKLEVCEDHWRWTLNR